MNDIRLRIITSVMLSAVSFLSIYGAAAAFIWWLIFCSKKTFSSISWKIIIPTLILVSALPEIVLFLNGGDRFYAVKISVILLIAFWFASCLKKNEFMDLFVFLFGNRIGFDLGLAADFSVNAISGIKDDFKNMRFALKIKGQKLSVKNILPLSAGLLDLSLKRADESAVILARRGYSSGGTYDPVFKSEKKDFAAFYFAIAAVIVSLLIAFAPEICNILIMFPTV